jgi:hypothetical protein
VSPWCSPHAQALGAAAAVAAKAHHARTAAVAVIGADGLPAERLVRRSALSIEASGYRDKPIPIPRCSTVWGNQLKQAALVPRRAAEIPCGGTSGLF